MFLAAAAIAVRRRARTLGIETMSGPWLHAEEATHHGLPLVAMGARLVAILQVMHQPVGHLVRHHLDQKGEAVLLQEQRIEAQPAPSEVGLAGTLAPQIKPDRRSRQGGMQFTTQTVGRFDPLEKGKAKGGPVELIESSEVGGGKRGYRHGMIEWRLRVEA